MSKETMLVYLMAGCAFLQGALFLRFAISASARSEADARQQQAGISSDQSRIERADDNRERVSPLARYVVSAVGFIMMGALLARFITPAVAYAFLCLSMVGRCVADQIVEERTSRRRSALIGRSRSADPVLVTWIALTGASALVLIPWLLEQPFRIAAVIVMVCVAIMVAVAWRIASAPPLLFGDDLQAEQVVDRETRALRTGNACVLTIGTVAIFVAFIGGPRGYADHVVLIWGLQFLWMGLLAWRSLYARQVTRTPLTS